MLLNRQKQRGRVAAAVLSRMESPRLISPRICATNRPLVTLLLRRGLIDEASIPVDPIPSYEPPAAAARAPTPSVSKA